VPTVADVTSILETSDQLVAPGRGILAADESPATMSKRLAAAGVQPSEEARRAYRELLLTAPALARWVSGVIFCDETFGQRLSDGRPFPSACHDLGIVPGVKVDTGVAPLALVPGATVTEGLDGLRQRLACYAERGAGFAKWRAVLGVGGPAGSHPAVHANAAALARYAALCQEAGLVPIVEPEVLMDGSHSLGECAEQTALTLAAVFDELIRADVDLGAIVLKPNMVVAGRDRDRPAAPDEVAVATLDVLASQVPSAVPGIAFLSGGQSNASAVANLAAMNGCGEQPWRLTFSFGRALVDDALAAWGGRELCWATAQIALGANCRRASDAARPRQAAVATVAWQ
jgi:fructose-bisphosphate aldolase, class I